MKLRVLVTLVRLAVACVFVLIACLLAQDRGGTPAGDRRLGIQDVFSKADASGSLEYWGVCNWKEAYPDFPKHRAISDHEGGAVELLREMFTVNPKMRVSQDPDGRIRIVEEGVPTDLLDVRIHEVRFPPEYHGPQMAVEVILRSPEVIAFRREHNIGPVSDWGPIVSFPSNAFAPSKPRVYGHLQDVTVREALDYVQQTFHGFWLYENCQRQEDGRTVVMGFYENWQNAAPVQTQK